MLEQTFRTKSPRASGDFLGSSKLPALGLEQVKAQWEAFQELRQDLESMIDRLGDTMASANQIYADFGITPTTVRRLALRHKVRQFGRRRKRYQVRDVLLAVLQCGTGRIRRSRSAGAYTESRTLSTEPKSAGLYYTAGR